MDTKLPSDALQKISEELFRGQKIGAVVIYRDTMNVSLADAKAAVERIEDELRAQAPEKFDSPPAKDSGGMGCAILLTAVVAGVLGVQALQALLAARGEDQAEEHRYSEALSIALLVMVTVQSCAMISNPKRRTLGYCGLAVALFLMAGMIYRALHS
jgi:hypothetical protein